MSDFPIERPYYRRPWHTVASHNPLVLAILDADDNTLVAAASPGVANLIITAVNGYPKLLGDNKQMRDALDGIRKRLRREPKTPAIKDAIASADYALAEDEEALEVYVT